jgi:hypothetical protein
MIARNRITSIRIMDMMKIHLNLRHTMNFIVLQGFVNQKNDVSGRLEDKTSKIVQLCLLSYECKKTLKIINLNS